MTTELYKAAHEIIERKTGDRIPYREFVVEIKTQWDSLTLVRGRWEDCDKAIAELLDKLQTLRADLAAEHEAYKPD